MQNAESCKVVSHCILDLVQKRKIIALLCPTRGELPEEMKPTEGITTVSLAPIHENSECNLRARAMGIVREVRCSEGHNVAPGLQDNCCLGHQKSSPRTSAIKPVLNSACIKLLQHLLYLSIFLLDSH
jgi:hypothetical protein